MSPVVNLVRRGNRAGRGGAGEGRPVPAYRAYTARDLDRLPHLSRLTPAERRAMKAVAQVLPFRVNGYVLDELVDWDRVPDDPMFRLVFPQPDMLAGDDRARIERLMEAGGDRARLAAAVAAIRARLNPHPAGQATLNVPELDGRRLAGLQHKYPETVLFFPAAGQTCHAYCSFCYRWAQFAGDADLRFAATDATGLERYLAVHPEVTDVLYTGGDPLVMKADKLEGYLAPLLRPGFPSLTSVRFGTKALTYWPWRFVSDRDADSLLRLFERLGRAGRQVALMAHFNHWRELEPPVVREAVRRIRDTGAVIRTQGPVLAGINDRPEAWSRLWRAQVALGMVPYYMFVERDTGPRAAFEVPLARVWALYRDAFSRVSGLARTVRGPSMSATPGKVEIQGVAEVAGEPVFVLRFLQGRDPSWVQRPFFARFDPQATWFDQLRPAFGEARFFFEDA